MLCLLWMLGKILWDFWRELRSLPHGEAGDTRFILEGMVAVMAAMLITGWFELNVGDSEVLLLFLALVGCGYSAITLRKSARSSVDLPAESRLPHPAH